MKPTTVSLARHRLLLSLAGWLLLVGAGTRLVLAWHTRANLALSFPFLGAFAWGLLVDATVAVVALAPVALFVGLLPSRFLDRPWARMTGRAALVGFVAVSLFIAISEGFFWDEFGVRFNFIAVDYLVYTQEVLGNIRESYPLGLVFGGLAAITALVSLLWLKSGRWDRDWNAALQAPSRRRSAAVWLVAAGAACFALVHLRAPKFPDVYLDELAKNGALSFVEAFRANQLEYERFYPVQPVDTAFARMRSELGLPPGGRDLVRTVDTRRPERALNVVQITVESLSAEFLARYGNKKVLTPNLDALASRSLVFDRLYATGNRTDRGMEALTLSIPPCPGRSLLKRADNENLFTLGSVLEERGYSTAFVYGGYGYFDNMNRFFGGNGYRVVDRAAVPAADITFANAWGACDEDLFRWELREADADHAKGRPFFHFVMTTSNHRPYTYPEGRIDLPPKVSRRAGAVKYTDYAIGAFLREAETHPWYRDTLFVIVADHCASSAGKTSLPVDRYHIPMLIFSPGGQVAPGAVDSLCSQIDYAPTLLGLLGGTYRSKFFGRDILAEETRALPPRAYVGTYQNLGLFDGERLEVLSPMRPPATLAYDPATRALTPAPRSPALATRAEIAYQTAGWLVQHRAYDRMPARHPSSAPHLALSTQPPP